MLVIKRKAMLEALLVCVSETRDRFSVKAACLPLINLVYARAASLRHLAGAAALGDRGLADGNVLERGAGLAVRLLMQTGGGGSAAWVDWEKGDGSEFVFRY